MLWATQPLPQTVMLNCVLNFIAIAPPSGTISMDSYSLNHPDIIQALIDHVVGGGLLDLVVETDYIDDYAALIGMPGVYLTEDNRSALQHSKFVIIGDCVLTGTANFTTTGMGYNLNNTLIICDPEIAALYQAEFDQQHGGCFGKACKVDMSGTASNGDRVIFGPVHDSEAELIALCESATTSIHIAIFYLTLDSLGQCLIDQHIAGVEVVVLMETGACKNQYSEYWPLFNAGTDIKCEDAGGKAPHSKLIIIDLACFALGSMNFSANGTDNNEENLFLSCNYPDIANELVEWLLLIHSLMPDWLPTSAESGPFACNDGINNNHWGGTDGEDPGCNEGRFYWECYDGIDTDGDYFIDGDDHDCRFFYPSLSVVWPQQVTGTLTAVAPYHYLCGDNPYTPETCDGDIVTVAYLSNSGGFYWKEADEVAFWFEVE